MEVVVAMTGASGAVVGVRLLEVLEEQGYHCVHLIVSDGAREVIAHELGPEPADFNLVKQQPALPGRLVLVMSGLLVWGNGGPHEPALLIVDSCIRAAQVRRGGAQ